MARPGSFPTQPHYNLLNREEERENDALCQAEGIGVLPWSPLARGRLAGAWKGRRARTGCSTTRRPCVSTQPEAADKEAPDPGDEGAARHAEHGRQGHAHQHERERARPLVGEQIRGDR